MGAFSREDKLSTEDFEMLVVADKERALKSGHTLDYNILNYLKKATIM